MSKIPTFDEFISEGLISKTVIGSKMGKIRKEDTNIYDLKSIDLGLPFLIADNDLEINGEDNYNYHQLKEKRKFIESQGWRIPTIEDLNLIKESNFLNYTYEDGIISLNSDKTNKSVDFIMSSKIVVHESYWLCDSTETHKNGRTYLLAWTIKKDDSNLEPQSCKLFATENNKYKIRLIKDK